MSEVCHTCASYGQCSCGLIIDSYQYPLSKYWKPNLASIPEEASIPHLDTWYLQSNSSNSSDSKAAKCQNEDSKGSAIPKRARVKVDLREAKRDGKVFTMPSGASVRVINGSVRNDPLPLSIGVPPSKPIESSKK